MGSVSKQENAEAPDVVGRRSVRLSMIIPITIQGVDASGQPFKENTWTIGVNKQAPRSPHFIRSQQGRQSPSSTPSSAAPPRPASSGLAKSRFLKTLTKAGLN